MLVLIIVRPGQFSSRYGGSLCEGAGNGGLHDLGDAIGDLETQYAAQPLLQGAAAMTAVPKRYQALAHDVYSIGDAV